MGDGVRRSRDRDADRDRAADRLPFQLLWTGRRSGWPAALVAATLASAVFALLLPAAVAAVTDAVLSREGGTGPLLALAALLTGGVLAAAGTKVAEAYCTATATGRLRTRLLGHVLDLGVAGERTFAAGDLASRAVSGAPQVAGAFPLLVSGTANLVMSAGGVAALWLIDWRLVATVALAVPFGLLMMRLFVRHASDLVTRYQELQGEISARMADALAGVRTIRGAGTWRREADRVLAPLPELSGSGRDLWRAYGRIQGQGMLLMPLTGLVALAVAGQGVVAGRISAGQMLAVAGYAPMALGVLGQVSLLLRLARLRAGARRIAEILVEPVPSRGRRPLPPGPGELRLRKVTVRGPDGPLLDTVDLLVPAGRSVAVVGRSGAGKTTLATVAGGLIEPDEGTTLLDGVPVMEADPVALRRAVAYAFERPRLLGTTVAEAIGYGGGTLPARRIERAATLAGADGFVRLLPDGYATALRDAPMSGGEEQRLGLARAFVREARLLVLDDATSSLDSVTEVQVAAALAKAAVNRTCLVVAHRVGTAARADLVAWLDRGKVRAVAPHRVLWADAAYRALFEPAGPGGPEENR
ncbi:ABC transporter ATP-binding protein [Actinopolymorpha pittospori]|uniref:ATP-binding cassette subfamily B protein n=1 Tax=Actinopolymorpha pittospori TaxID=648752 RepID=A0A927R9N4_9ACTN|nr:ABC transporter ATP-binding protein [Actinopolymorpha pittospori]MBE1606679.1 ATP-binding cassette subfamily B protein [Actinopolymorpha pittospori]